VSDTSDAQRDADAAKVRELRDLLPATAAGIYLDTANRGPLSAETAAAMREADDWELRVGRVWEGRDEDLVQRHDEARAVLAALIAADPDAITITPGLEAAAGLAQRVLGVRHEETVRLVDPATGERLASGDSEAGPRVADASLAVGAIRLSVGELGAEAVIFATDRWLLGPENVAALWLRRPVPGVGISLARTELIGLARSVGWLEMFVGLDWIYERGARLASRLHDSLSGSPGVDVVTPRSALATIVVFRLVAWPVEDAISELRRRVFAIVGPAPGTDAIRASISWFNTEEEIDRFAAAIAELGLHTPETLPRRPSLVVH
jgi:selenocysteine lyase/cysteine desulfurase